MMVKAIVIGAGIGGLAAGIALQKAGVDVHIYERAEELKDIGAGISLWANAIQALRRLGLGDELLAASSPYNIGGLRLSDGTKLVSVSMSELERKVGIPIVVLHRAELLALLLQAFESERVSLGRRCTGVEQVRDSITARFADGTHTSADVLIGADGLNSVVRSTLYGEQRPRYAGCTAWRAVVPFDVDAVRATETWGSGSVFGQVPMSGNRVYWYATKNVPEGGSSPHEKSDLLRLFRGWHCPIEQLIESTPESAILRNDIYDRPVLPHWSEGRITLLGDAAHPMTPFLGQGGCQAIEDAVVLAKCLSTHQTVASGLQAYDTERAPRANALVKRSRLIGRIAQLEHPLAVRLRNTAFKFLPPRLQSSQLARIVGHKV
jgi:2-polyprenyl-6-methoxyphenol hydroxylase-like FAD-dependent oxidoreductase